MLERITFRLGQSTRKPLQSNISTYTKLLIKIWHYECRMFIQVLANLLDYLFFAITPYFI